MECIVISNPFRVLRRNNTLNLHWKVVAKTQFSVFSTRKARSKVQRLRLVKLFHHVRNGTQNGNKTTKRYTYRQLRERKKWKQEINSSNNSWLFPRLIAWLAPIRCVSLALNRLMSSFSARWWWNWKELISRLDFKCLIRVRGHVISECQN